MTQQIIHLDFENQPIYESGAAVLTVLGFSEEKDNDDVRGRMQTSLCAYAIRKRADSCPEWCDEPVLMRPCHAVWPEKVINTDLRRLKTRLRARTMAAAIVLPLLKEAEHPNADDVRKAKRLLRVTKLAMEVADAAHMSEFHVKHRAWLPSFSVLHLAAAFELTDRLFLNEGRAKPEYHRYLWEPDLLTFVLKRAQATEPLLPIAARQHHLRFDPGALVRIRI